MTAHLCYISPKSCGRSGCHRGTHLPQANPVLDVYVTPSGNVWHRTQGCAKLVGRAATKRTRRWEAIQHRRCSSCFPEPSEVYQDRTELQKLAPVARAVLEIQKNKTGQITSENAVKLEKAIKRLQSGKRSEKNAQLAKELITLAEELLATSGESWTPGPLPEMVLRGCAATLLAAETPRRGERPDSETDRAARKLWPEETLSHLWKVWLGATQRCAYAGPAAVGSYGGDAHPGQDEALEALVNEWNDRLITRQSEAPGGTWMVVVPTSFHQDQTGARIVEHLGEHALRAVPNQPLGWYAEAVLVPVPAIVAQTLPVLEVRTGTLVQVPEGTNLVTLAETALGLWEGEDLRSLRRAFEVALSVQ